MSALCEYFPGADTPINYDDCEDDDTECEDDEYMQYDTQDSLDTDHTLSQVHIPTQYDATASNPVLLRNIDHTIQSPRPRSFVETQVSKLQHLMAAEAQPKTSALPKDEPDVHNRIGPVRIPQQFKKPEVFPEAGRSPVTINRTSSSPVASESCAPSEASSPQDSRRVVRSPVVFSESSSPRRLSPIANYNIGNINPRHIDIEQYWNRGNEQQLSPAMSSSITSNSNSVRKEDYNQNYCDRLSATNSPMTPVKEYNGNLSQRAIDPRYQTPLQIEVDPVSPINVYLYLVLSLEDASYVVKIAQPVEDQLT